MSLLNIFKRKLDSAEFGFLTNKVTTLLLEVDTLKSKIKQLETDCDNLRGQFNKKLRGIKKEEEKEEDEDLNTSTYSSQLPKDDFMGSKFKHGLS